MKDKKCKSVYIIISSNDTLVGKLVRERGKLKFWNRHAGDCYGHVSLSLDANLCHMMSFARKKLNNPLVSGLIREDIHKGVFVRCGAKSRIAVIQIQATEKQHDCVRMLMKEYWRKRKFLKYDFAGLFYMLITARGIKRKNRYICSHWVAEVLHRSGLYPFGNKSPWDVRPLDYYETYQDKVIYEGLTIEYDNYLKNYNNAE